MVKNYFFVVLLNFLMVSVIAQNNSGRAVIDSIGRQLKNEKNAEKKVLLFMSLGYQFQAIGEDSAFYYNNEAKKLSEKINFLYGILESQGSMANAYFNNKSDHVTALNLLFENLKIEKEKDERRVIFEDTKDIAYTYQTLNDIEKSVYYTNEYDKLIKSGISESAELTEKYHATLDDLMAENYFLKGQNDSAFYIGEKLFHDPKNIQSANKRRLINGSKLLGKYYYNKKQFDSAIHYYKIFERYNDFYSSNRQVELGTIFLQQNKYDSSLYYGKLAFQKGNTFYIPALILKSAQLLSELYQQKGKYDSAYRYMRIVSAIKDSIGNAGKMSRIAGISIKETLEEKKREQEKRDAVLTYQSKVKTYTFIGGIILLTLIIIFLYRNNIHRNKARVQIEKAYNNLKSTQTQLIQSEKMASLGELTAGIAHEIQNPLNFVNNFSEVNKELLVEMKEEIKKGNLQEVNALADDVISNEEKINHHGKRADAIVKGMLQHSRSSSGIKEPTDINALCDEYLRLSYHGLRAKDKSFNASMITDYDETIGKINIIPQDIGRVILNLINNAFYAAPLPPAGGFLDPDYKHVPTVWVSTKRINSPSGSQAERREGTELGGVLISVRDNGPGIPNKILDKIFQPFFTTKPTGQGTGLGLSLSYDIVKAHGGEIKVETTEGEGSEFIIQLPI